MNTPIIPKLKQLIKHHSLLFVFTYKTLDTPSITVIRKHFSHLNIKTLKIKPSLIKQLIDPSILIQDNTLLFFSNNLTTFLTMHNKLSLNTQLSFQKCYTSSYVLPYSIFNLLSRYPVTHSLVVEFTITLLTIVSQLQLLLVTIQPLQR